MEKARTLFQSGKIEEAYRYNKRLLAEYPQNLEAQTYVAILTYWKGNPERALAMFQSILKTYPTNPTAIQYKAELQEVLSTQISLKSDVQKDSQPLMRNTNTLNISKFVHSYFSPGIEYQYSTLNDTNTSQIHGLKIYNTFIWPSVGMRVKTSIGVYQFQSQTKPTYNINLQQKITSNIYTNVDLEKTYYWNTLSSLQDVVNVNSIKAYVDYNKTNKWNVRLGDYIYLFNNGAEIQNPYAWILSPTLKWRGLSARVGYAFAYANANKNSYESVDSLSTILANFDSTKALQGHYVPYFSPKKQMIHSVLVSLSYQINKKMDLRLRAALPLNAQAKNPYLYLDLDPNAQVYIAKGYSSETYSPMEFHAEYTYKIHPTFTLNLNYGYAKAFFFDSHQIGVGLNYQLR